MQISIKIKLAIIIFLLLSLVILVLGKILIDHQKSSLEDQMRSMASTITEEFAQNSKFPILENDRLSLNLLVNNLLAYKGITDAYIFDNKFMIQGTKFADKVGKPIKDFLETSPDVKSRDISVLSENAKMITLSSPILFQDTPVGFVAILFSKEFIHEKISDAVSQSSIFSVVIILAILLLSIPVATKLLQPIYRLLEGTREVSRGNYSHRIKYNSHDELGELVASFNDMAGELAKKEVIKGAFSRYVSPHVADEILKKPGEYALGGQSREATVLFADIRDFTALSQRMDARELVELLNRHFTLLTEVIFHYNGTVDKFMGDAVMGVFGSPVSDEKHFEKGIRAGLCLIKIADEVNKIKKRGDGIEIHIGVGLDSGPVIVGNMGSNIRMEYTAIGHTVNLASRLSGAAKKGNLLVKENILDKIKENIILTKQASKIFKGIKKQITPCSITDFKGEWKKELDETVDRIINEQKNKGLFN